MGKGAGEGEDKGKGKERKEKRREGRAGERRGRKWIHEGIFLSTASLHK